MARGAGGRSWRAQPNDRGHVGGGVIDSVAAGRGEGGGDAGHSSSTMAPPVGVQYMTAEMGAHHGGDRRGSTESEVQMGSPSPHTPPPLPTPPPPRPLFRRPVAVNTTAAVPGGGDSLRGGHPRRLPRLPSPGRRPPAAGPPAVRLWRQGRRPWPSAGGDRGGSPWPTPSPPSAVLCLSARTQPETGGGGGGGARMGATAWGCDAPVRPCVPFCLPGCPACCSFFFWVAPPPLRAGLAGRRQTFRPAWLPLLPGGLRCRCPQPPTPTAGRGGGGDGGRAAEPPVWLGFAQWGWWGGGAVPRLRHRRACDCQARQTARCGMPSVEGVRESMRGDQARVLGMG